MKMTKCPICGKSTAGCFGNYRKDKLCITHGRERDEGLLVQCDQCKSWHKSDLPCKVCEEKKESKLNSSKVDVSKPNSCLLCGKPTNGYHFCSTCYTKIQNKDLILKISKCKDVEVLRDDYINKKFVGKDGHILRSQQEKIIDDFLYDNGYKHSYEEPLFFEDEENPIFPDWHLPEQDLYIEHLGVMNDKKYNEVVAYKFSRYKKANKTIICTYPEDIENPEKEIRGKLNRFKKGEVNFFKDNH